MRSPEDGNGACRTGEVGDCSDATALSGVPPSIVVGFWFGTAERCHIIDTYIGHQSFHNHHLQITPKILIAIAPIHTLLHET